MAPHLPVPLGAHPEKAVTYKMIKLQITAAQGAGAGECKSRFAGVFLKVSKEVASKCKLVNQILELGYSRSYSRE